MINLFVGEFSHLPLTIISEAGLVSIVVSVAWVCIVSKPRSQLSSLHHFSDKELAQLLALFFSHSNASLQCAELYQNVFMYSERILFVCVFCS